MKSYLTLLAATALIATPAIAQKKPDKKARELADQKAASAALARGEILPIAKVLEIATAIVPGDVLKVKLEREPFGFKYEVKILAKNGRVREVEVDARSGKLLQIEDD